MPGLPVLSGAQVARAFERAGWRLDRQRGSHAILVKPGQIASLSVPQHREVAPGTLRAQHFGDLLETCTTLNGTPLPLAAAAAVSVRQ